MKGPIGLEDRVIPLGPGLVKIPERLLLAHARGEALFITGAGISMSAGLPDFRNLVVSVYQALDTAVHKVLEDVPRGVCNLWEITAATLNYAQQAEIKRFIQGDYDVVLGMLERRIDGSTAPTSKVRSTVTNILRDGAKKPTAIHNAMIRLADRGHTSSIVTTNFDLLLEAAASRRSGSIPNLRSHSLGAIPRPGKSEDFSGILHIHGALERVHSYPSNLIVTDRDFGEFYLRRRIVPDFIYDAARLFNLVLVGYSANDAPMRYLLNAVAADGFRFSDVKERFAFVGMPFPPDPVSLEDWHARGITPIPYDSSSHHVALVDAMTHWAELSPFNGKHDKIDVELKRIVRKKRSEALEQDRDLFDHLVRRANPNERNRISSLISKAGADLSWLDSIIALINESRGDSK